MAHETELVMLGEYPVEIDTQVVHILKFLNQFPGVKTISSCQGTPGVIDDVEHGFYGHVFFVVEDGNGTGYGNYYRAGHILFGIFRSMFRHLYDDVRLGIDLSEDLVSTGEIDGHLTPALQPAFICMLHFRNEAIPEVERRLGGYLDGNFRTASV